MEKRRISVYNGDELDKNDVDASKYLSVNSCGFHNNAHQHIIRTRGRKEYQISYVDKGEMIVNEDGVAHRLSPGGFVIFKPGVRQDYVNAEGVSYWVHFTGSAVEEIFADAGLHGMHLYQGRRHEVTVGRVFERLIVHFASYTPMQEAMLCADLMALIVEIGKLVRDTCELQCDERIRPIILSMNRNFKREIDLNEYARMAGVSRSRFGHLFKENVGASPYAYILDLRLTCASDLLLATDEPISGVAFAIGFSDPLYFSRLFKKKYGQSPEKYRKSKK